MDGSTLALTVRNGEVALGGSVWLPSPDAPAAAVLMHPGSGPSDRHNDVFFPPIRQHLLAGGCAVCSFDKRGVGGSSGHWHEAAVAEQADDALAGVAGLRAIPGLDVPVGLFGHSQGGWVVLEAASRRPDIAFVVVSSGSGVSPAAQERYAAGQELARAGLGPAAIDEELRRFDELVELMRGGASFEEVRRRFDATSRRAGDPLRAWFVPDDPGEWALLTRLFCYDPRPLLERIEVPVLALFGGADRVVPVEASVAAFQAAVRPDLLQVAVFPEANHRLQVGDPPQLAPGYLDTLTAFIQVSIRN